MLSYITLRSIGFSSQMPCKIVSEQQFKVSQPVSRVLSWTIIHLGLPSPTASSGLPESDTGNVIGFLFGLAPSGVYLATVCCHPRGALLPHPFTLTVNVKPTAVYFLLHFPWAFAPQALPGTAPYGARTFLPSLRRIKATGDCPADSKRA